MAQVVRPRVVQADGSNRGGEDALAPLVEAFGGPLRAVLAREDRLLRLGPWRGDAPFVQVGGQVIEEPDRAPPAGLRCADDERPLLYVRPPQPAELLRPKPGVRESGDDGGVAEVQRTSWESIRARRDASFGSAEEQCKHPLDGLRGEWPHLLAHRRARHPDCACRVGQDELGLLRSRPLVRIQVGALQVRSQISGFVPGGRRRRSADAILRWAQKPLATLLASTMPSP